MNTKPFHLCEGGAAWKSCAAWGSVALLLVVGVPVFLCQHLANDTNYYDVQTRIILDGGVLYRDAVEPNLPGVVWIHMFVRSLFGWSGTAIRAFDLVVFAGTATLLALWNRLGQRESFALRTPLLVLAIFWYHFSLTEWCHCQRDGWMLLPALAALTLRDSHLGAIDRGAGLKGQFGRALLEGLFWGAAFWIKPHISIPALFVMAACVKWCGWSKSLWTGFAGVLVGGLIAGAAGSAWLIETGAWPYFWEMQLNWNPEYLQEGRERMSFERLWCFFEVFAPWTWAHLIALPLSAFVLIRRPHMAANGAIPDDARSPLDDRENAGEHAEDLRCRRQLLLCALYAGWILQSLAVQFPFGYVLSPPVVLAMGIVAGLRWKRESQALARMAIGFAFVVALLGSPLTEPKRLANWWDCVTKGPTPGVRANIQFEEIPNWNDLSAVIQFLVDKQVGDRDVLAYDAGLVCLYNELGIVPPNRFVYTDVHLRVFDSRQQEIREAIETSPHTYIVNSLFRKEIGPEHLDDNDPATGLPRALPPAFLEQFPFTQPIVFRSGWYVVHKARRPIGPLSTAEPQ